MAETKYGKYFITELHHPARQKNQEGQPVDWRVRVLYLDDRVLQGVFYLSSCWYTKGIEKALAVEPHRHACDEVLAFIGNDPNHPLDLGGEIEMWIDAEKHLINKSCLVFIPKGMPHCPMRATRADRPIFHFSTAPAGEAIKIPVEPRGTGEEKTAGTKYDKYFVTQQQYYGPLVPVDWKTRVLSLDNQILEGAFFTSVVWYTGSSREPLPAEPHLHDCDEILAFVGNNPDNPLDLGGEIELWMDDEKHMINKSSLIFIPKGLPHCPMWAKKIDRPILHFTAIPAVVYTKMPVETK